MLTRLVPLSISTTMGLPQTLRKTVSVSYTHLYLDLANKNALAVAGNSYQNAYRSFFGRVMYNYDSRYYLPVSYTHLLSLLHQHDVELMKKNYENTPLFL